VAHRLGKGATTIDDRCGSEAVVGDDIHIVYGSSVPLVIRRLEPCDINGSSAAEHGKEGDHTEDPNDHCTMLGTCYMHGIMDGEVLGDLFNEVTTMFLC
jgi:hypothetical protein